jgi:hypothetical protein
MLLCATLKIWLIKSDPLTVEMHSETLRLLYVQGLSEGVTCCNVIVLQAVGRVAQRYSSIMEHSCFSRVLSVFRVRMIRMIIVSVHFSPSHAVELIMVQALLLRRSNGTMRIS